MKVYGLKVLETSPLYEGAGRPVSPYAFFEYPLPKNGQPGEWVDERSQYKAVRLCRRGLHASYVDTVTDWLIDPYGYEGDGTQRLYLMECDVDEGARFGNGRSGGGGAKFAVRRARLVRRLSCSKRTLRRLFRLDERGADATEYCSVLGLGDDERPLSASQADKMKARVRKMKERRASKKG